MSAQHNPAMPLREFLDRWVESGGRVLGQRKHGPGFAIRVAGPKGIGFVMVTREVQWVHVKRLMRLCGVSGPAFDRP